MTRAAIVPTLLVVMALLTACNTTDALTPQVDIGDSSGRPSSSPVTQSEAERLAGARQPGFAGSPQPGGYHPAYDQSQRAYRPGPGAPPTTMQEQADALSRNSSSPAASAPIEGQALPPPASDGGLDAQSAQPAEAQQPQQTAAVSPNASSRGNTVRFLPIIGAPVQAVTPLSRQLGAEARAHGLSIKSSTDASSDYILKGYLSAFSDDGKVTVVYVWDVLDSGGGRLHRIQGQESVPTAAADPWAGVPASVMQQIGSKTIAEFSSWRQTQGG
ncbi:hypothetical protein GGE16_003237 [Rhizobium leguminosarum]|uniref:Lipoprotein n=1 Tax=Rhizobium leguminosarum TaxID=384 RepID=A0AAE2SY21_RHILE|nr:MULTISPECIES: hypothetical protein [Rhizobium]MBB4291178.1 hypothetical protein [Rhizobium leguminosarum]MBB4297726.1 hypothetical protein [Rhizobium leguminosarum]MBB4308866.1 hypothetical protein [Rhizobium leguminosarum]MBB4430331.1 hypothetical protein [Rhizobium esperanzae]MBB4530075.1 hypothetical protein [Rhizobium leguminosarum]